MKNNERQQIQEMIEKLEGIETSLQKQMHNTSNPTEKGKLGLELGGLTASRKALESVA